VTLQRLFSCASEQLKMPIFFKTQWIPGILNLRNLKSLLQGLKEFPELLTINNLPVSHPKPFFENPAHWIQSHFKTNRRKEEWIAGRLACIHLYQKAKLWPLTTSVSHCSNIAIACAITPRRFAIGIDIEPKNRRLSERLCVQIFTPEERQFPCSPIQLWTIKEAAYKAFRNSTTSLQSIQMSLPDFKEPTSELFSGVLDDKITLKEGRYWSIHQQDFTLSLVSVASQNS